MFSYISFITFRKLNNQMILLKISLSSFLKHELNAYIRLLDKSNGPKDGLEGDVEFAVELNHVQQ